VNTDHRLLLARQLVAALESGDNRETDRLLSELNERHSPQLVQQLAEIARDVHDAFCSLVSDKQLLDLTKHEIPDARDRLSYVIEKSEEATHRTLTAIEALMPLGEHLRANGQEIGSLVQQLTGGGEGAADALGRQLAEFTSTIGAVSEQLRSGLSEIMMAQEYQDLTGQVIKRTIDLVSRVEINLIKLISPERLAAYEERRAEKLSPEVGQGPAIRADEEVVSQQSDVDDLLADLGV
jgi:chemotaxis protein CheZ